MAGQDFLKIYNISDPNKPVFISALPISGITSMDSEGELLYVMGFAEKNSFGLIIIDVSDLIAPTIIGFIDTQTYSSEYRPISGELSVSGSFVYVLDKNVFIPSDRRIVVIDALEPNQPRFLSSFGIQNLFPTSLEAKARYLYAAGVNGLVVVNMVDPTAPQILPFSPTREAGDSARALIEGGRLYFAGRDKLKIFSLDNPENPVEIGRFDLPAFSGGLGVVRKLSKSEGKLFTLFNNPTFPFGEAVLGLNVDNPEMITASGSITIQSGSSSRDLSSFRNFAIVADGPAGVGFYDMADSLAVNLATRIPAISRIADIIVKNGSHAYVSSAGQNGIHVVDVTDPMAPMLVNNIFLPRGEKATDLLIKGPLLYVSTLNDDGVFIYDITEGASPVLKGDLGLKQRIHALASHENLLFLSQLGGRPGFRAVDISSAPTIQLIGGVTTCCSGAPEATFNLPRGLEVDGSTVYLAVRSNTESSINIFDVSNIERPLSLGTFTINAGINGFLLNQQIGYVSTGERLVVIDFSNPASPTALGTFTTQGSPKAIKNKRLYVAGRKLEVLDVSAPDSIKLIEEIDFKPLLPEPRQFSELTDLVIDDQFIYASVRTSIAGVNGLMTVIKLPDCGGMTETPCRDLRADFQDALTAAGSCTTDGECIVYSQTDSSFACFTTCASAIRSSELASIENLKREHQARFERCGGGPCPVPSCPPQPAGAECVSNRCELIRSGK